MLKMLSVYGVVAAMITRLISAFVFSGGRPGVGAVSSDPVVQVCYR